MSANILIAGSGPLAAAIERRLRAAGAAVTLFRPGSNEDGQLSPEAIEQVSVLVLAADDDSGNVDLALQAKRMRPSLPLVVRLFENALATYLAETLPDVTVLSMSAAAAPVIADAALRMLDSQPQRDVAPLRRSGPRYRRQRFRMDRVLVGALLSLFLLVFPSAYLFSQVLDLRYLDALYFVWTTVMTVGYGDIALKHASDGAKLFGMALMLAGASFIAVLFALLSDWVVSRRLDVLRGRTQVHASGHLLIAGCGNIGFRVALLRAGGDRPLVIIERDADSRNAAALRMAGHHVIIADATHEEILMLAGLEAAALMLAVTDSDAVNLQIALHARACGVPVIMRVDSPELSAHVSGRGNWFAVSPIDIAAELFARAALQHKPAQHR